MVRDYASKERRKEKEASEESKTAKREAARYRETSEVAEESLDGFSEEIKGKSKRERVLKEQRKKSSRLSFGDESDGMVHGAGIGIRSSASAVKDAAATAAHWKTHEAEDDNAAVEGAHRAELAGENLARKSIYTMERLKQRREQSKRLKESVLDEAEKSRLMFESVYGNEAKNMVKKEAEQKRKSALQKLFQKKRYQKQYQAAKQSKKGKGCSDHFSTEIYRESKRCSQNDCGTKSWDFCYSCYLWIDLCLDCSKFYQLQCIPAGSFVCHYFHQLFQYR